MKKAEEKPPKVDEMLQSQFVTLVEESGGWNKTVQQLIHAFNILLCVVRSTEMRQQMEIRFGRTGTTCLLDWFMLLQPAKYAGSITSVFKTEDAWSKHKPAALFHTQIVSEHQGQTNSGPSRFHCKHQYFRPPSEGALQSLPSGAMAVCPAGLGSRRGLEVE